MKTKMFILMLFVIAGVCNAAIDWDIYGGNETIETGDVFGRVSTYTDAVVDMVDGEIDFVTTYDDSIMNISGGHVGLIYVYGRSTVKLMNGSVDSITVGANISYDASIIFDCDLNSLNFTYDQDLLVGISGNWNDSTTFDIQIDNNNALYPTGDFIEFIPEPTTLLLLGLGGLFLRTRKL